MSSKRSMHLLQIAFIVIMILWAVPLLSVQLEPATAGPSADPAVKLAVDETADAGSQENVTDQPPAELETSLTKLQKALDAARESETPEEAVQATREILRLLAELQSKSESMSADRQAQMREAVIAAQDLASNADVVDPSWKSEFRKELKKAQECLDQEVKHDQEARQFAAAVIVGLMALFILFIIFLIVPELGCLIFVLIILGVLALLIF